MPEHIRALVVILGVALPIFWLAQRPLCADIIDESTYRRDRNTWVVVTLIAFLSHNFWLYVVLAGAFLSIRSKRHKNPLALYCLVLFAAPPLQMMIPGFGPIDHIITVDHYRLLNIAVLLPLAKKLYSERSTRVHSSGTLDFFIVSLGLWMFLMRAWNDSITSIMRAGFYLFIDVWLPYYTASRALRDIRCFRQVAANFVVAALIVAVLAVFESNRHWLLYESLRSPLGFPEVITLYLQRGGALRANVSVGNAIVLGYALMVAIALLAFLFPNLRPAWKRNVSMISLLAGLIAALSRGPWVGAAAMLLTFFVLGPGLGKRLAWLIAGGGTLMTALLLSPLGDTVIAFLPFVGTVETENIDYRARLFDVSIAVLMQNPLLGDYFYLRNPLMEQMRQGQGIIDIVNAYIQVALPYGLIGLLLFTSAFITAIRLVWRVRQKIIEHEPESERLGRALLGAQVGILITIATVSNLGIIPTVYWLMIGFCSSYARVAAASTDVMTKRNPLTSFR